jgi:hypothetical protein
MNNEVVFRRSFYIVVRSYSKDGTYYTIINVKTGKHSHVYSNELTAAIMICKSAHKKIIPEDYPDWMKESIRRILDNG